MKTNPDFTFYMPVEIIFGEGRVADIGRLVSRYGKKAMLVTTPLIDPKWWPYKKIISSLESDDVSVVVFDKIKPNPTVDVIDMGAALARQEGVEVIIGFGGGSSMDAAKGIAVGATHPGSIWDYNLSSDIQPGNKTLPIIAVGTTAGTGAQITSGAVITNAKMAFKSGVVGRVISPKACIVDPEITYSMPPHLTATTGFDAFSHVFESFIHETNNILIDRFSLEAIRIVAENLPIVVKDGANKLARRMMAMADTLGGICIENVGTTLFHSMGMAIGGHFPHVSHGEALIAVYPSVLDFSWQFCKDRFAAVARIFDPALANESDDDAARLLSGCVEKFLELIGTSISLTDLNIAEQDLDGLTDATLKYTHLGAHPVVPTKRQIRSIFQNALT